MLNIGLKAVHTRQGEALRALMFICRKDIQAPDVPQSAISLFISSSWGSQLCF